MCHKIYRPDNVEKMYKICWFWGITLEIDIFEKIAASLENQISKSFVRYVSNEDEINNYTPYFINTKTCRKLCPKMLAFILFSVQFKISFQMSGFQVVEKYIVAYVNASCCEPFN